MLKVPYVDALLAFYDPGEHSISNLLFPRLFTCNEVKYTILEKKLVGSGGTFITDITRSNKNVAASFMILAQRLVEPHL